MSNTLFLASKGIGALPSLFSTPLSDVRFIFVPTATKVYEEAPWTEADRVTLQRMGFSLIEFDFHDMDARDCEAMLDNADIVYIQGGNTFYLLQAIQQCNFGQALRSHPDVIYAGASAGTVVAGVEVGYVSTIDDKTKAPHLASTRGLSLTSFNILPHFDHQPWRQQLDDIVSNYQEPERLITIQDNEAIIVRNGQLEIVPSE